MYISTQIVYKSYEQSENEEERWRVIIKYTIGVETL